MEIRSKHWLAVKDAKGYKGVASVLWYALRKGNDHDSMTIVTSDRS
jgi:hypothetical protein